MTDYSQMTDHEIDKRIGDLYGLEWANLDRNYHRLCVWFAGDLIVYSPCTDPKYGFPVIEEHRINIFFDQAMEDGVVHKWCGATSGEGHEINYQTSPLRAAMIVVLMKQEENLKVI